MVPFTKKIRPPSKLKHIKRKIYDASEAPTQRENQQNQKEKA